MSNHCPKCGTCHEEDDGRVCAACSTAGGDEAADWAYEIISDCESLATEYRAMPHARLRSDIKADLIDIHRRATRAEQRCSELEAENAALAERLAGAVSDEWRVRYYQLRSCISTDPMMDGSNKIRGVNIPLLNVIIEEHRNNPVEEADDANH